MPATPNILTLTSPQATDDGRVYQLLGIEQQGLTLAQLAQLQKRFGLSEQELAYLMRVDLRTLQRQRAGKGRLSPKPTSALLAAIQVLRYGEEVFGGDLHKLMDWARSPNGSLADQTPLTLLPYSTGREMVSAVLTRIDYGVFG